MDLLILIAQGFMLFTAWLSICLLPICVTEFADELKAIRKQLSLIRATLEKDAAK